jgi:hypothetical protein
MQASGSPLAGLRASDLLATQTALIVAANILLWLVAPLYLRSLTQSDDLPVGYRRLIPIVGALGAAVAVSVSGTTVPTAIALPIGMLGDACVPVLLFACARRGAGISAAPRGRPGTLAGCRRSRGEAAGGTSRGVGLGSLARQWPEPGYQLVFAIGAPTAVLTSQVSYGDSGTSAVAERTILWPTVLSVATLSAISAVLR